MTAQLGVAAEVTEAFERYERALLAHDVRTLNDFFLHRDDTVRYGLAEEHYGYDEIAAWRATTAPRVAPGRRILRRVVAVLNSDTACVSVEFADTAEGGKGRQSQTWLRTAKGWKIAAAHVSRAAG